MSSLKCFCVCIFIALFTIGDLNSAEKNKYNNYRTPSEANVYYANRIKQGYNLRVWMSNQMALGLQAWDGGADYVPDGIGCEYPAGAMIEHLYGAGPIIGAIVDGKYRVVEGYNGSDTRKELLPEYSHLPKEQFWRTSIWNHDFDSIGYNGYYYNTNILVNRKELDDDGDGLVDEDELDGLDNDGDWNLLTDDVGSDGLSDPLEISCDGVPFDTLINPDPADDNYDPTARDICHPTPDGIYPYKNNKDKYTEKNEIPDHGEPHVDEDYGAISQNDLYCSATDTFRRPTIVGHVPIGVKVVNKSYAWEKNSSGDAIIFLNYDFINVGNKPWQDAYIGMFADPDLGPVNTPAFYHNCTAYDYATRTGYVYNPVDTPSTPLGFTLISSSRALDSLYINFWWTDFTTPGHIDPGTNDSLIYWLITGGMHPSQPIADDQDPNNPTDTRFFYTFGNFQVQPAETLKMVFAMVSGMNIPDMLDNARKARRIYESGGFIMPMVYIADSGIGKSITISWDQILHSPTGNVVAYRVYRGTSSGNYSDSATVTGLSITYSELPDSTGHYFTVRAIDDLGNSSALSEEVSNAPYVPKNFRLYGQQTSINLQWDANADPDIRGYNVYRAIIPDTSYTLLNIELTTGTSYFDTSVTGNQAYSYMITAVDWTGYESGRTMPLRGNLIPPEPPKNFVIGLGETYLHLNWSFNTEEDFAGYNLYRKRDSDTGFVRLNSTLLTVTDYIETSIDSGETYQYYIEAVDRTGAVSRPTYILNGYLEKKDKGLQLLHTRLNSSYDPIITFNKNLLNSYKFDENTYPYWIWLDHHTHIRYLNQYSSVVWFYENLEKDITVQYIKRYPIVLKSYLLSGGKLLIIGRQLSLGCYPYWLEFLSEIFGVNPLLQISNINNFNGASGEGGFPNVNTGSGISMGKIERFPGVSDSLVLYRMRTDAMDSTGNGEPVGLRAIDPTIKAYYLSFPLHKLDSIDASTLLTYVLNEFGEYPLGVITEGEGIPNEFKLHNAFPNPFNPSTSIKFDLPQESYISLVVYDVLGKEVAMLVDERKPPGSYKVHWDASGISTGIYFYRISVYDTKSRLSSIETKKVILVK